MVTTHEKLHFIRRILTGLGAFGSLEVLAAVDTQDLPGRAWRTLPQGRRPDLQFTPVTCELTGEPADTGRGSLALVEAGASLLITLGGDGTNRLVASAVPNLPLLPYSTGTNNAFPFWMEPTVLGLAAGAAARFSLLEPPFVKELYHLEVTGPFGSEMALIDVAVLTPERRGKAVWDPRDLRSLFLTRGEPGAVGLSSILGWYAPLAPGTPEARVLSLDPGALKRVLAPIGPGLMEEVGISRMESLFVGEVRTISGPSSLAFDGEPLANLGEGETATIRLVPGPHLLDPEAILPWASRQGALLLPEIVHG